MPSLAPSRSRWRICPAALLRPRTGRRDVGSAAAPGRGPRAGQARRPGPARAQFRRVHRADPGHRAGPALAAPGGLAGHLGHPLLRANPVHAARYAHLSGREHNLLKPTQAQTAVAAALLRQLHAVTTAARPWNAQIATHGTRRADVEAAA